MDPTVENTPTDGHAVETATPTSPSATSTRTNKAKRNYRTKKRDTSDDEHDGGEDMKDGGEDMKDDSLKESTQHPQQPAASSSNLPYVQSQNAQNIGEVYPGLARLSFLDQDSGVEGGKTEQEGGLGDTRPRRPLQQKSLPLQQQRQSSLTSLEDGGGQTTSSQPAVETLATPPSMSPSATSSGISSESNLIEIKDTALENKGRGLFSAAKDVLKAGTLVFKEMGYCQVVNDTSLSSVCSACFKDTREEQGEDEKNASAGGVSANNQRKLVRCAGCKVVWYCNKTCQIKDWKLHHQLECQGIQQSMKNAVMKDVWTKHSIDTTTVRALCRLVRRRERVRTSAAYKAEHKKMDAAQKLVNEVYYSGLDQKQEEWLDEHGATWIDRYLRAPANNRDVSSKGVLDESTQFTKIMAVVISCVVTAKEDRATFMRGSGESEGESEGTSATKGFELLRKLLSYGFSVTNLETTTAVGLALYVQSMPFMNHSCLPNCVYTFKGSRVECRVIRDIQPGEELTISYIDQIGTTQERQKQLKEQYHFTCMCPMCQYFPANPLIQPNQDALLAIIPESTFVPLLDPKQGFICPNSACATRSDIGPILAIESQLAIYNKVELKCESCGQVPELTQEIVQENQEEAERIIARFVREMNGASDQQPKSSSRNFELAKIKLPETTDENAAEEARKVAAAKGGMNSVHEPSTAALQCFDEAYRSLTGVAPPQARTKSRQSTRSPMDINEDPVHRSALHRLVRQLEQAGFDEAVSHKNWVFALHRSLELERILNNTYIGYHPLKAVQGYYTCKIVNLLANLLLEESTIEIEESDHEQDSDEDEEMADNSDDERDLKALRNAMGGGSSRRSKGHGTGSMQEQLLKRKQAGSAKTEDEAKSKTATKTTPSKRIQTESSRQLLVYLKSLIPKIEDPALLQQFRVCWGKDGKLANRYRYQVDSLKQALYYAELPFQETKPKYSNPVGQWVAAMDSVCSMGLNVHQFANQAPAKLHHAPSTMDTMTAYSAPKNNDHALTTTKHESEATEAEKNPQLLPDKPTKTENPQKQSAIPMDIDDDSTSDDDNTVADDSILPDPTMDDLMDIKEFLEAMTTADREIQQELHQYIKYIKKFVALLTTYENSEQTPRLRTLRLILLHLNDAGLKEGKAQYRRMFSRLGKSKEVVPIDGPDTMKLINQVIRLQFLKEKVLSDTLKADAISVVIFMIKAKTLELVQDITYDHQLIKDLFDILKNPSEPTRRRNDVVLFVHQLCTMAKKTTIDVYSPRLIRILIIEQTTRKDPKVFFDAVLNQVILEPNVDSIFQFADVVQALLDVNPEVAKENNSDRLDPSAEASLDLFYSQYLSTLVTPVLELMRMALKFFRACMDLDDDYFSRMLIRNKVIHSIIGLLKGTKGDRNAMNSARLEFFDHIQKQNIRPPPQATIDSARPEIPWHYARPFFKNFNKAEGSETGGPFSGPLNGCENGAKSVEGLMLELFGYDGDDVISAGNDAPQPNVLRRKLEETDFDEAEGPKGSVNKELLRGKQDQEDQDASAPSDGAAFDAEQSGVAREIKTKRPRDDEGDVEPHEAIVRAEPRNRLDISILG
ncbi:SET and MYND domain-containing protein 3 [Haplosporangium gracile]|nr:SET and MYND domain-containing protein 3 [Haplosporangium gracile]